MKLGVRLCSAHAQLGINFTLAYGINVLAQLSHIETSISSCSIACMSYEIIIKKQAVAIIIY